MWNNTRIKNNGSSKNNNVDLSICVFVYSPSSHLVPFIASISNCWACWVSPILSIGRVFSHPDHVDSFRWLHSWVGLVYLTLLTWHPSIDWTLLVARSPDQGKSMTVLSRLSQITLYMCFSQLDPFLVNWTCRIVDVLEGRGE